MGLVGGALVALVVAEQGERLGEIERGQGQAGAQQHADLGEAEGERGGRQQLVQLGGGRGRRQRDRRAGPPLSGRAVAGGGPGNGGRG